MTEQEKDFLVSLSEAEIILIAGALAQIAEVRSDLAQQCVEEGRFKQSRAHTATATKCNNLGERLFSLVNDEEAE